MNSQEPSRIQREAEFWDHATADGERFRAGRLYNEVNRRLWKQILDECGDLSGRRLLFVGCGTSAYAAKQMAARGAEVWCVDVSPESLKKMEQHPFGPLRDRIHFRVGDAERLPFEKDFFHVVVGKSIVHHLEIGRFMAEVQRISTPGGLVVFSEPLAGNPLIRLFRWLTPGARVPTEHPLTRADMRHIAACCSRMTRRYHFLLALAAVPVFFVGLSGVAAAIFRFGCRVDDVLMRVFPPAGVLAWSVTLAGRLNDAPSDRSSQRDSERAA